MSVFRGDFAAANNPALDERGDRLDFPALRTSYITRLQRAGVSPREAVELARGIRGERGIRTPENLQNCPENWGISTNDTQIDTQNLVALGSDFSLVVTARATLAEPLKAAILAIIKTAG